MVKKSSVEKLVRRVMAAEAEDAPVFQPGDILYSRWGYDQTNVNYYQVMKCTLTTTWVREIEGRVSSYSGPYKNVVPVPGKFVGPLIRRKSPDPKGRYQSIRIESYELAVIWDGKPKSADYLGGH